MPAAKKREEGSSGASVTRSKPAKALLDNSSRMTREFVWDIVAISNHFEEIRRVWAKLLGVTGPQWQILMAISDLDLGQGVSVGDVSAKIRVNSPFITTQTKALEKDGLLIRSTSKNDARIVLMSLTNRARLEIDKLSVRRNDLIDTIFTEISDQTLREISEIRRRAQKAALQLEIDLK